MPFSPGSASLAATNGLGLADQRSRIEAYCRLRGLELTKIISDAAVSGGRPLASRAGGAELVSALRRRDVRNVVMLKLDRGFRNAAAELVVENEAVNAINASSD